jgi:hypothetical protein
MTTEYLREQARQAAELRAKEEAFYDKLNRQPATEVLGLVDPSGVLGVCGFRSRGKKPWTLLVTLASWRDHEGTLHRSRLNVRSEMSKKELDKLRAAISAFQIIRLLVRIGEDAAFDSPQAALIDIIDSSASDPELEEIAHALQQPVTLETKVLGKLTLDRSVGWYEGTVRVGMKKIQISIDPDDIDNPEATIESAERLVITIKDWDKKARDLAAKELLSVKNDFWLEEGEAEVTAEQFKKRMKTKSITVHENGRFDFWYEDGDLFLGHSIEVRGNFDSGFTDAGFHG